MLVFTLKDLFEVELQKPSKYLEFAFPETLRLKHY